MCIRDSLESSSELIGVGIEEEYLRKYNYSKYIAHIIGYTGKVSESELEELKLSNPDYTANDVVGKSGIESIYETVLAGKKGTTTMLVDTLGRVQEITAQEDAQVGNDIYLTIDVKLQEKIYNLLERRLAETLITNIVEGDETNAGLSGDIVMPVTRVYFAFIDNNMINMDKIAESDTEAAKNVYSVFSSRKAEILNTILAEMQNGTPYNQLSDDMKEYIKRIRTLLIEKDILSKDKISSEDELSKKWSDGTISLKEYLEGAISNEWININNLDVSTDYPTTDEVIAVINELVMEEITKDSELNKLIYKELILNRTISGRLMCMILMEQGAVNHTDSEYVAISNGASPYEFVKNKRKDFNVINERIKDRLMQHHKDVYGDRNVETETQMILRRPMDVLYEAIIYTENDDLQEYRCKRLAETREQIEFESEEAKQLVEKVYAEFYKGKMELEKQVSDTQD